MLSFVPSIYINTMGYFFTWGKEGRFMVGGTVGRGCLLRFVSRLLDDVVALYGGVAAATSAESRWR